MLLDVVLFIHGSSWLGKQHLDPHSFKISKATIDLHQWKAMETWRAYKKRAGRPKLLINQKYLQQKYSYICMSLFIYRYIYVHTQICMCVYYMQQHPYHIQVLFLCDSVSCFPFPNLFFIYDQASKAHVLQFHVAHLQCFI